MHGDTAYAAWRDAGMVVLDVADRAKPKLIVHKNWSPPFGGGTHNCLPLPDRDLLVVLDEAVLDHQEDGLKLIWVFDNRAPEKSGEHRDLPDAGGSRLQGQGRPFRPAQYPREPARQLRELDFDLRHLSECRHPRVRHLRSIRAERSRLRWCRRSRATLADTRPNRARVIQSADVFVDAAGLIYATDYNAGLYILEYDG